MTVRKVYQSAIKNLPTYVLLIWVILVSFFVVYYVATDKNTVVVDNQQKLPNETDSVLLNKIKMVFKNNSTINSVLDPEKDNNETNTSSVEDNKVQTILNETNSILLKKIIMTKAEHSETNSILLIPEEKQIRNPETKNSRKRRDTTIYVSGENTRIATLDGEEIFPLNKKKGERRMNSEQNYGKAEIFENSGPPPALVKNLQNQFPGTLLQCAGVKNKQLGSTTMICAPVK